MNDVLQHTTQPIIDACTMIQQTETRLAALERTLGLLRGEEFVYAMPDGPSRYFARPHCTISLLFPDETISVSAREAGRELFVHGIAIPHSFIVELALAYEIDDAKRIIAECKAVINNTTVT